MKKLLMIIAMAGSMSAGMNARATDAAVLAERGETQEQHDKRMSWFREARFGLFIHWGIYSQAAGKWNDKSVRGYGEWIMNNAKVPMAEYAKLAEVFNPVKYDAEKWVLAAKDAGMKYIVITAKHHDGFGMFPSKASTYNISSTPFKRDPLKELSDACKKHGMRLGFYYSQNLDWHHPGGGSGGWDPAHQGDSDKYVDEIVIPQVREILTNYGDISIIWWDIPGGVIDKPRGDRIHKTVMALKPDIIMNNRLGGGYKGDTETPEQHIPGAGNPVRDWETCMTMNGTWGFKQDDQRWKSSVEMLRMLCDIASKGGNYLLNVGPTCEGEIPQASLDRLAEVGKWTKVNGDAIYATTPAPFPNGVQWGRLTQKGKTLYLMVFDLPKDGALLLPGLKTKVTSAYLLADAAKKPLTVTGGELGVTISIPEGLALDPAATVVTVELADKAMVELPAPAPKKLTTGS
ncbi:MAG: alpha-L-fucosidase [bacterium]